MTDTAPKSHRFSITFKPAALDALEQVMARERLSQTDAVNRAVQVYDFIAHRCATGDDLVLRRPDGTTETVHII